MSFHLGIWNAMSDGQRVQECAKLAAENDHLRVELAEALKANDELNAECMRLSASKEDVRLYAQLAEAKALLVGSRYELYAWAISYPNDSAEITPH